jgi:hypothetical protein
LGSVKDIPNDTKCSVLGQEAAKNGWVHVIIDIRSEEDAWNYALKVEIKKKK